MSFLDLRERLLDGARRPRRRHPDLGRRRHELRRRLPVHVLPAGLRRPHASTRSAASSSCPTTAESSATRPDRPWRSTMTQADPTARSRRADRRTARAPTPACSTSTRCGPPPASRWPSARWRSCYAYFEKVFVPIQIVSTFFFVEFLIRVTVGFQLQPDGLVVPLAHRAGSPRSGCRPSPSASRGRSGWSCRSSMTVITNADIHGALPRTICLICLALCGSRRCSACASAARSTPSWCDGAGRRKDEAFEICAGGACDVTPRVERVRPLRAPSLVTTTAD